jgi:dTDP-4-dehydrorhamnose 3,5-epimerase
MLEATRRHAGVVWHAVSPLMEVIPTRLPGTLLLSPRVFGDDRGFFTETYRAELLAEQGVTEAFIQDNHSRSRRGVVRGMHFQIGEGASKIVRCGRGSILDVVVDIRRDSATYGQWESYELTDANMRMVYVPIGFAHGFAVLSDVADVLYKQSNYYSGDVERGFAFDDPDVAIEWPFALGEMTVSGRDRTAPRLSEISSTLPF